MMIKLWLILAIIAFIFVGPVAFEVLGAIFSFLGTIFTWIGRGLEFLPWGGIL